ncbi:MAG: hypothetical protein KA007_01310 [Candidatus Pacebacteria bacterium]|nr:hypothetical protein [Candidatus Paceibacterota bacterium]
MKDNQKDFNKIKDLIFDMVYLSPVKIYKKYGIGFQTQEKIKESAIRLFSEDVDKNICLHCSYKLLKKYP